MRLTAWCFSKLLGDVATNSTLDETINFGFDGLDDSDISQVINSLALNNTVRSLDLCALQLSKISCQSLGAYLNNHHTLEILKLDGNDLEDEPVQHLLEGLHNNKGLRILDLSRNRLTDKIISYLLILLQENSSLTMVDVSFNNFSERGIELIKSLAVYKEVLLVNLLHRERKNSWSHINEQINILKSFRKDLQTIFFLYDPAHNGIHFYVANCFSKYIDQHPGKVSIFDYIQTLDQLIEIAPKLDLQHNLHGFITHIVYEHDLFGDLFVNVLTSPPSKLRNYVLGTIGDLYFVNLPKKEEEQIYTKLIAYICLKNMRVDCEWAQELAYQAYRWLIGITLGLSSLRDEESSEYKREDPSSLATFLQNLNTIEDIQNIVPKLQAYRSGNCTVNDITPALPMLYCYNTDYVSDDEKTLQPNSSHEAVHNQLLCG